MKEDVSFNVESQKLVGTIYYPQNLKSKNPAVLFIHGWTSNQNRYKELAERLNELGLVCLTFDMRGHGESDGDTNSQTRNDFIQDVVAAYDFLADLTEVEKQSISVIGSSLGAYLAAILTSLRPIKAIVLRAPANYPEEGFDQAQAKYSDEVEKLKWRHQIRKPEDTTSLRALHNFAGQVLVVESGNDEIIPHRTVQNYLDAVRDKQKLTHIVVEGAPHSFSELPKFQQQYAEILYKWFASTINWL